MDHLLACLAETLGVEATHIDISGFVHGLVLGSGEELVDGWHHLANIHLSSLLLDGLVILCDGRLGHLFLQNVFLRALEVETSS